MTVLAAHSATSGTLADALWSGRDSSAPARALRFALLALVGSILLALSAHITVPMWPVPMTMQTFMVLVLGMAYGRNLAGATLALYLAEGFMGLPVFTSLAGPAAFAGPTAGYLVGFVAAAMLVGALAEKGWDRSVLPGVAAMLAGTAVIFAAGVSWLALGFGLGWEKAIAAGMLPFLAGAGLKIALAAVTLPMAWKLRERLTR